MGQHAEQSRISWESVGGCWMLWVEYNRAEFINFIKFGPTDYVITPFALFIMVRPLQMHGIRLY